MTLEWLINPIILYVGLALGAGGVAMALPRKGGGPQIVGALLAATGLGLVILTLAIVAGADRPNLFFYIFGAIALGGALRVISHPRPVYAALYFILTIISSSAMYLLLGAEFLTFALIIIYAGAILITYLFVIMLATQAPSEDQVEALTEYDANSREPIVATVCGFALLAVLTGMMATGAGRMTPAEGYDATSDLARVPKKIERWLDQQGLLDGAKPLAEYPETKPQRVLADGTIVPAQGPDFEHSYFRVRERRNNVMIPMAQPVVLLNYNTQAGERLAARIEARRAMMQDEPRAAGVAPIDKQVVELIDRIWDFGGPQAFGNSTMTMNIVLPDDLRVQNIEAVGFALLGEHPLVVELAGVVLLLALVGAVILARKQIEIGQDEKAQAVQLLGGMSA